MKIDTTEIVNSRLEYFYNPRTKDTILNRTISEYKSGLFKINARGYIQVTDYDLIEPYYGIKGKGYYSSHNISSHYFYWDKNNTIDSLKIIYKKHKNRDTLLIAKKKKNIFNKVKELQFENSTSYYKYSFFGRLKSIKKVSKDSNYFTLYNKGLLIQQETSSTNKKTFEYDKKRRLIKAVIGKNDYFTYTYDSKDRIITKDRHQLVHNSPYLKRNVFIYEKNRLIRVDEYAYKDGIVNTNKSSLFRSKIYKYKNAL
jgi:hypothetical protein